MAISVVIPTFNRAETIQRALRGVFSQTVHDLEVIVVDDGSTDNTQEIVSSAWGDRVSYHVQKNQGASAARNRGAELATGEYIAFLDSDDEWEPRKLELQLGLFESSDDPRLGVVLCARTIIYPGGRRAPQMTRCLQGEAFEDLISLKRLTGIATSSFLVHRRVFEAGIRFDTGQAAMQDWDFLVQTSKRFNIRTVPEMLLVNHKEDGGNHIHTGKRVLSGRLRIMEKYESDLNERPTAKARHLRGVAGAYRTVGDMPEMRTNLRAADEIDPTVSGMFWRLPTYLGAATFNTVWLGTGVLNKGLAKTGLPRLRGPFE